MEYWFSSDSIKMVEVITMLSRTTVVGITVIFGLALIMSGLHYYYMNSSSTDALFFGVVTGVVVLVSAYFQATRLSTLGDILGLAAAIIVGGLYCYKLIGIGVYETHTIVMVALPALEIWALASSRGYSKPYDDAQPG